MQVNLERRNGMDRRHLDRPRFEQEAHGDAPLGSMMLDAGEPYDPYDPYWEPLKGQDDD
jgi:hypothetical protein